MKTLQRIAAALEAIQMELHRFNEPTVHNLSNPEVKIMPQETKVSEKKHHNAWTKEEINVMVSMANNKADDADIAKAIKRHSLDSCRRKMRDLGFYKRGKR